MLSHRALLEIVLHVRQHHPLRLQSSRHIWMEVHIEEIHEGTECDLLLLVLVNSEKSLPDNVFSSGSDVHNVHGICELADAESPIPTDIGEIKQNS